MKNIQMMYLKGCPHCKRAFAMMTELMKEHPEFQDVKIETIEEQEQPEIADALDYYYVPTYYVDHVKMHEGVPTKEALLAVLNAAL